MTTVHIVCTDPAHGVNAWLTQRGSSLGALVGAIDTAGDAHLARRLARMNGA